PRERPEQKRWLPTARRQQIQTQSCEASRPPLRKAVTLAYLLLHENRHHFVSKEHSLSGQAEAGLPAPQAAGFEEWREVCAEPAPDVHSVPSLYGIYVDSVNQSEAGKERIAQPLVRRQRSSIDLDRPTAPDFGDIFSRRGDVLPPDTVARRMGAAAEA